ncbi:MAG: hypothetical protein AB1743_06405 [Actinomycetota bacterium]
MVTTNALIMFFIGFTIGSTLWLSYRFVNEKIFQKSVKPIKKVRYISPKLNSYQAAGENDKNTYDKVASGF